MVNHKVLDTARQLVGQLIKERREELRMTQTDLADRAGIGAATIQRIECGRFFVSMKQFWMLCEALDLYFWVSSKNSKEELPSLLRENLDKLRLESRKI